MKANNKNSKKAESEVELIKELSEIKAKIKDFEFYYGNIVPVPAELTNRQMILEKQIKSIKK